MLLKLSIHCGSISVESWVTLNPLTYIFTQSKIVGEGKRAYFKCKICIYFLPFLNKQNKHYRAYLPPNSVVLSPIAPVQTSKRPPSWRSRTDSYWWYHSIPQGPCTAWSRPDYWGQCPLHLSRGHVALQDLKMSKMKGQFL